MRERGTNECVIFDLTCDDEHYYTSYNKVENNTRDIAIDELERFADISE